MTAVAVLGALALALLIPLLVAAGRQRTLLAMALRNIRRRRSEARLVIGGALLGTAIITSAFVVGDVVEGALSDTARTQYGPIDISLSTADGADIDAITTAVEAARIPGLDGLLVAATTTATLEVPDRETAVPQVRVLGLDLAAAGAFGADPRITGVAGLGDLGGDQIVLNDRPARQLDVGVGDAVRMHANGADLDLVVSEVTAEVGLAGHGGAIVAPATVTRLTEAATSSTPPGGRLLVSLDGGVFDTRDGSDAAVAALRAAVGDLHGVQVVAEKAALLDDAEREGAGFTELFSVIGSFSVLAGLLLLVNLFVMLAEERKTELGMLRAIGFTRRRLVRAFAIEGAIYALVAATLGAVVGIGIGWLVAVVAGTLLGVAGQGAAYPLVIEPVSLVTGATTGLVISLLTIWATSQRIARLNVIRAIRDLPAPRPARAPTRTLVVSALFVVAGAALGVAGYLGESGAPFLLGVPMVAFGATPWLRLLLPERSARLLVALTVLAWTLSMPLLFRDIVDSDDPVLFVLQGVVLTAGAVSFAGSLDRVWLGLIERLGRGGRGLAPRLGVAYPLAHRLRTSMLLGMFSLVIFTVTIISAASATFETNIDGAIADVAAGFDIVLDANPTDPVDAAALLAHDDVVAAAGLVRGIAEFEADHLDGTRSWAIAGIDAGLLERGAPVLARRDPAYRSDAAAFRAVIADPTLAIVPNGFLAGVGASELDVGDTFGVIDPSTGEASDLTVAGLGDMDWLGNGALVGRDVTATLLGAGDVVSRSYLALSDGAEGEVVAAALNASFLRHGASADTMFALVSDTMGQQAGLLALLQGFLGLGLLVGTAGLGVVMVRAVRERRQQIGMLRAIGVRAGVVRAALLSEAGLIAVQGTVIGAVLGLITARQLLATLGDDMPFTVPWVGLVMVVALPVVASLAATAWPAGRAAAIQPAVALRTAD